MNTPQGHTMSRRLPTRDAFSWNHHPRQTSPPPALPPSSHPAQKPLCCLTTKTQRKEKKDKAFQHFQRHFWPLYHSSFSRFFLIFFWPYVLPTQFFIHVASTKEMYITVSNFRYDLYFFSFYDIPSCHVFSQLFLVTIHPYFIADTAPRFPSRP